MQRRRSRGAFTLILLCLLSAAPLSAQEPLPPTVAEPTTAPDHSPYLDGLVEALMNEHQLPGLMVAVTDHDVDRLIRGYGLASADGARPVDPNETLFRIGSVSKTFTWTAVMMLVDRGQLDLDRNVNDYLRAFKIEDAFDAPITMNDLMAHRAGFEDTLRVFQPDDDDPRTLGETLAQSQPARVFPPGARTSYSNWGSALAAHIVEAIDGRPFIEFLDQEILAPLQMTSTTLVQPAQLEEDWMTRLAQGLRRSAGVFEPGDPMQIGPFAPAGGIAASASDMGRWMRFHLNGGELDGVRLLSAETHARMLTRHFDDRPGAPGLAHGFQNYALHGTEVFGHGGSTGNFQSLMLFVPELGFGVFASQNSGSGGYQTVNLLTRLLIEREIEARGGSLAVELNPAESSLGDYAGSYRNNRRSHHTLTAAFNIEPTATVQAAEDGSLITRINGNTDRFYPMSEPEDTFVNSLGQHIHFQRDDRGRIVALNDSSGVHSHERVSTRGMPWAILVPVLLVIGLTATTLLGFWKRWGQRRESTAAGRRAARRALIAAIGVSIYFALALVALVAISGINAATIGDFPPTALTIFSTAGWGLLILTALLLSGLLPAWRGSGWSILRRLHYTAYALALPLLCAQLWYWNLFGAPLI